jgi:RHS repeat-associated protein
VSHGYTSHEHDDPLGLINMNGRYFDPTTKRFISADPIVSDSTSSQAWNPYAYVRNNPTNRTDPSGYRDGAAWSAGFDTSPAGFVGPNGALFDYYGSSAESRRSGSAWPDIATMVWWWNRHSQNAGANSPATSDDKGAKPSPVSTNPSGNGSASSPAAAKVTLEGTKFYFAMYAIYVGGVDPELFAGSDERLASNSNFFSISREKRCELAAKAHAMALGMAALGVLLFGILGGGGAPAGSPVPAFGGAMPTLPLGLGYEYSMAISRVSGLQAEARCLDPRYVYRVVPPSQAGDGSSGPFSVSPPNLNGSGSLKDTFEGKLENKSDTPFIIWEYQAPKSVPYGWQVQQLATETFMQNQFRYVPYPFSDTFYIGTTGPVKGVQVYTPTPVP